MNDFGYTPASYAHGFASGPEESAFPELWEGLVGLWAPSLGPTGLTLFDHSGNGNNGDFAGGMSASTGWVMTERGWVNDYGWSQYIDLRNTMLDGAFVWTVVLWLFNSTLGDRRSPFGDSLAFVRAFPTVRYSLQKYSLVAGNSDGFFINASTSDVAKLNEWEHLAFAYNGADLLVYRDGKLTDTLAALDGQAVFGTNVRIGGGGSVSAKSFGGRMGDASVYNRALNANEIMDMFLGAHPLTPLDMGVMKAPDIGLLLRMGNMDGGMHVMNGGMV